MLLKAPEEDQPGLMEEAKAGTSARQLAAKATAATRAKAAAVATAKTNGATTVPSKETTAAKATPAKTVPKGRPTKEDRTITLLTKVDGGRSFKALWRTKKTPELSEWKEGAYAEIKLSDTASVMVELLYDKNNKGDKCIGVVATVVPAK